MAPGAGFEPARAPWPTGSQGQLAPPLIAPQNNIYTQFLSNEQRNILYEVSLKNFVGVEMIQQIVLRGNKLIITLSSPDVAHNLLQLFQMLGVRQVEKENIVIKYEDRFWRYLTIDRNIDEVTARSYCNYIKRLEGREISYDLYLEIANNKWAVKAIRIYLTYLYRTGRISREELSYWKEIFKVKNKNEVINYVLGENTLIDAIKRLRRNSVYRTILEVLCFSGARLSEVIKMMREFDIRKLVCFSDFGFCRYGLFWSRGRKRCDWIYFPISYIDRIQRLKGRIGTYQTIRDNIYDECGVRSKYYRKLFYQVCKDLGINNEICDFYQGRISKIRLGDARYDRLMSRADKEYSKIMDYFSARLS